MSNPTILDIAHPISIADIKSLKHNAIVFYNDEWVNKHHICTSILDAKLHSTTCRIFARDTSFCVLESKQAKLFFEHNHIAGNASSSLYCGLLWDGSLVSAISFRTPFTKNKQHTVEIARFCSVSNTIVAGGLSKLLYHSMPFLRNVGAQKILTYADLRFGEGKSYEKVGFKQMGKTKPNYYYSDGTRRFNRFKFRAQNGVSEKDVAQKANVHRVYDRGSNKYEMTI